jgi:peptidoglycan/xylan/chitin deacetylase (PgdA/CDA1 family)
MLPVTLAAQGPLRSSSRVHRFARMQHIVLALLLVLLPRMAAAGDCPGNPAPLGTARVMTVDPAQTPRIGRKQFPATLPLSPKEVVLTFDDGPWPGTTDRVLDALRHECVHATFFLLGRNAVANQALARRELAEGHTVAHHTYAHPLLRGMALARAEAEINRGFAAVDTVLYGKAGGAPATPFFRFPGFASNRPLLDWLEQRGIAVFGADLWASDWEPMAPQQQVRIVMQRLKQTEGGILLLHDIHRRTAAALPQLLRELKDSGYRVVHIVPPGKQATQPQP